MFLVEVQCVIIRSVWHAIYQYDGLPSPLAKALRRTRKSVVQLVDCQVLCAPPLAIPIGYLALSLT
jgi:hypothetical protein